MARSTLRNYWHPIALGADVTDQPKRFKLLGEPLVAFRTEDGVCVFADLCIHRGAALSGGWVKDGNITCPYHGWTYDRSGACVHIPSLPPGATIPPRARAIPYPVREEYGLVWVALDAPAADFPQWPDDAWSRDDYRAFFVEAYDWRTSAGRVVENVMDFSHFNFVHVGYTELADGPVIKPYDVNRTGTGLEYVYEDTRLRREYQLDFPFIVHDRKKVIASGNGGTWSESADTREGDVTILSFIAAPVDDIETRIYVFVARNHSLDKPDADFAAGFDEIMEQDRRIVETQRPEKIPADIRDELHIRFPDAPAVMYRRLLREIDRAEAFVP